MPSLNPDFAFHFALNDLVVVGFLTFLEGILSIDNALVLAILAKDLPPEQRRKALSYGLIGAVIFRLIALFLASALMQMAWVKFVGGGYLLLLSFKHFFFENKKDQVDDPNKTRKKVRGFWTTVFLIELTDIAFAVDSILAAIALSPKFWVVFTGGILGVILMRYAATVFVHILEKFPRFEDTAYLLVALIGGKVVLEGFHFPELDFHNVHSPAFWIFWLSMLSCILYGFKPKSKKSGS